MRIIAGNLGGFSLYLKKDKTTRPLKDSARESIFNLITHSKKISFNLEQSNILDLYAGTGSFGLECLSRKAKKVYFVENDISAINILNKNIEKLEVKKFTHILSGDVINVIKNNNFNLTFNLIFCDPPYKNSNIEKLIEMISSKNLLKKDGLIILHRHKNTKDKLPSYVEILEERLYGISKISFLKFLL